MKYLRYLFLVLVFVMVPFIAYANTCDNADIKIQGLELLEKTGSTVELNEAELVNNKISTDVKMYEVGDSISYQFTVVNDSNDEYVIDKNSLMINNDTMDYKIESSDNSYIIDKNSSKKFTLSATYKNEVDASLFKGGKYEVGLDQIVEIKDPSLINPFTGNMFYYLIIIISIICIVFVVKGKKKKVLLVALFGLLFVPFSTYALCTYSIDLDVGLKIGNIKPTYCTYDGEISYGTEYINGQFTYYYGKEYMFDNDDSNWKWRDIGDGWNVQLTDKDSTDPVTTTLCTYINDIPVTSLATMFYNSHTTEIDTSSYDTSHITSMNCMFEVYYRSDLAELNVSNFDTSNVTDISWMFSRCKNLTSIDVSNFDTSNVIHLAGMFDSCESLTSLDVSNFETSKVIDMCYIFECCYALTSVDVSNFDTSSVVDMCCMFYECYALTSIDVSNFDTSKVIDMDCMFCECYALTSLDLSNFNTSNVVDMSWMFSECHALTSLNVSNFNTSNVTNSYGMKKMFYECTSLETLDLSSFDMSNVVNTTSMFSECSSLTTVYARTQADIDILNASSNLPGGVQFELKSV